MSTEASMGADMFPGVDVCASEALHLLRSDVYHNTPDLRALQLQEAQVWATLATAPRPAWLYAAPSHPTQETDQ